MLTYEGFFSYYCVMVLTHHVFTPNLMASNPLVTPFTTKSKPGENREVLNLQVIVFIVDLRFISFVDETIKFFAN